MECMYCCFCLCWQVNSDIEFHMQNLGSFWLVALDSSKRKQVSRRSPLTSLTCLTLHVAAVLVSHQPYIYLPSPPHLSSPPLPIPLFPFPFFPLPLPPLPSPLSLLFPLTSLLQLLSPLHESVKGILCSYWRTSNLESVRLYQIVKRLFNFLLSNSGQGLWLTFVPLG